MARADGADDGLRLAAEARCAEALPLLGDSARAGVPRARALCLLELADYAGAARELAALEAADPTLAAPLGIARFHAGDRVGAEQALQRAEVSGDARAEVPLYLGLIALANGEGASAAQRFERARASGGDALAPAASYYGGLARARGGDARAGHAELERVEREWPGTPWAEEASRALAAQHSAQPYFAALRLGFEHDSNVVLRGAGVALPQEISSQADQLVVWRAVAGRSWVASPETQLGGALTFGGSSHLDLTSFDALYPSVSAWADRRLDERLTLRGLAAYAHAWVDGDAFLSAPRFALELHRDAAERGATRFFGELALDDYLFESTDPPALARRRDRDGTGFRIGAEHRVALPELRSSVGGALAYHGFWADGSEYSFDAAELELSWESALPAKLVFGANALYAYRPYRNGTTYEPGSPERTEHEWRTDLWLGRPVWRQLAVETRWRYQRNRSTAEVFDYSRHVVGLYLSWTLNP
jgi:tetratricopeptide (TPR) repeat protein